MQSNPAQRVAQKVRAEMAKAKLRQTQAARALGLSQSAFSRRFCGYTEFRASEVQILAGLLEVEVSDLLDDRALAR